MTSLKKLPEVFEALSKVDLSAFSAKVDELVTSLKPLESQMKTIGNGFSSLGQNIQKVGTSTDKTTKSTNAATGSFTNFFYKGKMVLGVLEMVGRKIWSSIEASNEYTENMNLFTVAMGEYAESAKNYADEVSKLIGIDPSEWVRSQGIFMTMATGFGVAGDRASIMSKNLTQLGYDLASFYNIDVEDAMTKLKSGLAGELEPLRAIGYDLSQAKLEATALALGIDKSVSSMTQAEKAQLRYYAILTQVTVAQGDMARTLDDPANQIRVLKSQLEITARSIGNIFIPALQAVLP